MRRVSRLKASQVEVAAPRRAPVAASNSSQSRRAATLPASPNQLRTRTVAPHATGASMRMCSFDSANALRSAASSGGAQVPSPHITCAWLAATSCSRFAMLTMEALPSVPTS